MDCIIYPLGSLSGCRYVVIFSRYRGQWLFSRHRERLTWETQGGHIEPGETPLDAARRELYEESGAAEFKLQPVFEYKTGGPGGVVFTADITALGPLPGYEMAETALFDRLPPALTYPAITPVLYAHLVDSG